MAVISGIIIYHYGAFLIIWFMCFSLFPYLYFETIIDIAVLCNTGVIFIRFFWSWALNLYCLVWLITDDIAHSFVELFTFSHELIYFFRNSTAKSPKKFNELEKIAYWILSSSISSEVLWRWPFRSAFASLWRFFKKFHLVFCWKKVIK